MSTMIEKTVMQTYLVPGQITWLNDVRKRYQNTSYFNVTSYELSGRSWLYGTS